MRGSHRVARIQMPSRHSIGERILFALFVPPLAFAPIGIPLFLLGVEVTILRDAWYLSIFIACLFLVLWEGTPPSQIGVSKKNLISSLLLAGVWEALTYILLGVLPFFALTGRTPILVPFSEGMVTPALRFMLVGIAEETWMRGLLLERLRGWKPRGPVPVVSSSAIFVLYHVPAAFPILTKDVSVAPLLAFGWSTLFVWSVGLAQIVLKTRNLLGPIAVHGLDDFLSKILYPLQI